MVTIDLTTPPTPPATFLDGLARRLALTLPELRVVAELARLIDEENRRMLAGAEEGDYVTVVVATMLSSEEPRNQRDLSAGVNELRGAYLAQLAINKPPGDDSAHPTKPLVRLVLANFGGNSAYAEEAAERRADQVAETRLDEAEDIAADARTTEQQATAETQRLQQEAAEAESRAAQLRAQTEK